MAAALLSLERPAAAATAVTTFTDIATFGERAHNILLSDSVQNTLLLSHLRDLQAAGSAGEETLLALLGVCEECVHSTETVLLCPGRKGVGSTLYVSAAPICPHTAQLIAQQLHCHPYITRLTTTAANTDMLLAVVAVHDEAWHVTHNMHLMLYKQQQVLEQAAQMQDQQQQQLRSSQSSSMDNYQQEHQTSAVPAQTQLQQRQQQCPYQPTSLHQQKHHHPQQQQLQQQLRLQACSPSNTQDADLTLSWCTSFLAQVFHTPHPPPAAQVEAMVHPRLRQGLYWVLRDCVTSAAMCMIGYVVTSEESARISMLWTPEEHRGKGYGRFAVNELCRHLQHQGYTSICLLADTNEAGVVRLYQACGFVTEGTMQLAEKK